MYADGRGRDCDTFTQRHEGNGFMNRQNMLLAMLAAGRGRSFEPVHVQKAMFLIGDKLRDLFDADSRYHFTPYDYGPYDSAVYDDLGVLEGKGLVVIARDPGYRYRRYQPSPVGLEQGRLILGQLDGASLPLFQRIVDFVLSLDFRRLVSAIYEAYPHMKEKSVFKDDHA
jgi:uncharacterized protein